MVDTLPGARLLKAAALAVGITGCWSGSSAERPRNPPAASVEALPQLPADLIARNATLLWEPTTADACESVVGDLAAHARENDPNALSDLIAYLRRAPSQNATTSCVQRAQALYCDETLRMAGRATRVLAVAEVRRRCAGYLSHGSEAIVMQFAAIALWPRENLGRDAYLGIAELASYALDLPDADLVYEEAAKAYARAGGCSFVSLERLDSLLDRARSSTDAHAIRGTSALSSLRVQCAPHL